jgi:hypothetical protein
VTPPNVPARATKTMILPDQSKRLSEPVRWTRMGKIAVASIVAGVLVGVLGLAVYSALGGTSESAGCVDVTFASTLGGSRLHACGERAREVCASPASNPEATAGGALRTACEQAGYPYGPSVPGSATPGSTSPAPGTATPGAPSPGGPGSTAPAPTAPAPGSPPPTSTISPN